MLPPEKTPGWVSMWEQHPTAAPNLELKGSFRRLRTAVPVDEGGRALRMLWMCGLY